MTLSSATGLAPAPLADSRAATSLRVQRILALAITAFVASRVPGFPGPTALLATVLGLYALALHRTPLAWLVVLPALIPVLDLTPVSGRFLFNEFDFLVLLSIAGCLWHGLYASLRPRVRGGALLVLALLIVAEITATARGLLTSIHADPHPAIVYYSELNALRVFRGFAWAALLLPALQTLVQRDAPIARSLCAGMLLGLAACTMAVAWERLLFPGPFDFSATYRVTGLFSGMHTGGAFLDAYLAMSVPFFAAAFYVFRGWLVRVAGAAVLLLGVHALLVTYSQTNLAVLALIIAVFVLRDLWASLRARRARGHSTAAAVLLLTSLIVAVPILGGAFFAARLDTIEADLGTRTRHWHTALELIDDSPSWLIGRGRGAFPRAYREATAEGRSMASFRLREEAGEHYVQFTPSGPRGDLHLRQRLEPVGPGRYYLSLKLRTRSTPPDKLLVEFCERNILQANAECLWYGIRLDAAMAGEWQVYNRPVDLTRFGHRRAWLARPLEISLLNRGLKGTLDIAHVQITGPRQTALLRNPGFEQDLDGWFYSTGNHLPWHIKNMALSALFEGGLLGLVALLAFTAYLLRVLGARSLAGDPFSAILLASLGAVLVVGVFDSPFDEPRIAFLFYLLGFSAWCGVRAPSTASSSTLPWTRLVLLGVVSAASAGAAAITWLAHSHDMGVHQVARIGMQRLDINWPWLQAVLEPEPRYADQALDGRIRRQHPRILLPELFAWGGVSPAPPITRRRALYEAADRRIAERACRQNSPPARAACYLATGDEQDARRLLAALESLRLDEPRAAGGSGVLWQLALGYDLVQGSPVLADGQRAHLQARIADQVQRILSVLDDGAATLWHRRMSLASNAWLGAVVLDPGNAEHAALQTRAQGHVLDNFSALALSEAWPEGYNYWINNRGLLVALAGAAYVNGLEGARHAPRVRELLRRAGLWTVYATRPDGRIEGLGDEGPRVDLKDETRRVIDIIAQITRDPVLAGFSAYLRNRHGAASYYRGYHGQFLLFNDPTVPAAGNGSLASVGALLPHAAIFGRDTMNLAYVRSGWGSEDTFISFRAGHTLSHHGHYDAGHFSLFKGAPLAINSSTYTTIASDNRLYYAMRSIAKNTLLILRPGEHVQPNRLFERQVADGGQRLTQPTGGAIDSTRAFLSQLHGGKHLQGGIITAFEEGDDYVLIGSDLTDAYNSVRFDDTGSGGKVSAVKRQLLYLRDEDRLLIHDDITATDPAFVKKWLLHTAQRPHVNDLQVLRGTLDDGILQSGSARAVVRNGDGVLVVERLFPRDALLRLVGGDTHRYYVESDGDESELDGENYAAGASDRPWFDQARWRIEIQPPALRARDRFLVLLSPSLGAPRPGRAQPLSDASGTVLGVRAEDWAVVFVDASAPGQVELDTLAWPARVYMAGFSVDAAVSARLGSQALAVSRASGYLRTLNVPTAIRSQALIVSWE